MSLQVLSLFSGIGGLDLGLEWAGMRIVGQVERDEYCRRVLTRWWPEVPRHDDVRTTVDWWRSGPRPRVDLIAGGFPCQPVSVAGRQRGAADDRWLWPAMASVVDAIRPWWVVAENVPGLRTNGLGTVLGDLDRLGYTARAGALSAAEMGAPHRRDRIFILAHTQGYGCGPGRAGRVDRDGPDRAVIQAPGLADPVRAGSPVTEPGREVRRPAPQRGWWATEPPVGRVAPGIPGRVDRLRALGNAVVPQCAEHIGRLILASAEAVTP